MYIDKKGRETAVICVCPIKNEGWILNRFLTLASEWADYIIIADQMSDDGSDHIAKSFDKVIYVLNESEFNEKKRSTLLLNEVRKIKADKKLVFTLDADECLTLNWNISEEWNLILEAEPKTVFGFNWINLLDKKFKKAINIPESKFAYVDDGLAFFDLDIFFHAPRIPNIKNPKHISLSEIAVLHFQYIALNRYYQKNAWYQCKEVLEGNNNFVSIFRSYHKHIKPNKNVLIEVNNYWVSSQSLTFDLSVFEDNQKLNWYGKEVVSLFLKHGEAKFKKLNIWEFNWFKHIVFMKSKNKHFKDPRNFYLKIIHSWLTKTQGVNDRIDVRVIQKLLSIIFKI